MKYLHVVLIAILACGISACNESKTTTTEHATTPQHPETVAAAPTQTGMSQEMSGSVLETMDTAGYTYVKVKTATKEIWAAAPQFKVAVGDAVIIPAGMVMPNYHSNTLNRDFAELYFVSNIVAPNAMPSLDPNAKCGTPSAMAAMAASSMDANALGQHTKPKAPSIEIDFNGLSKAENGYTVAEIFAQQADLATQEVVIRAKVVKFSPKIMKTNWIHLQDGSGTTGTNDLTITTNAVAAVGDTVLVKGILDLNQDFGYGYKYDVIIQDAQVTVE